MKKVRKGADYIFPVSLVAASLTGKLIQKSGLRQAQPSGSNLARSTLEPEIWNLKSGIWNLESEIWNLKSEIWNLEPGI